MRLLSVLLLFSILSACSTPATDYNEELLKKVLIDIHIADAAVARFTPRDRDSIRAGLMSQVFEIHQLEQADFDSMMTEIQLDARAFRDLYAEVKDSLEVLNKKKI